MKRSLVVVALGLMVFAGFYFLIQNSTQETQSPENSVAQEDLQLYTNEDLGIAFEYKTGPSGYQLQESTPNDAQVGLKRSIVLTPTANAEVDMPVGGEGPATITLQVFENANNEFPLMWAEKHVQYSNINLKTSEVEETVTGGANAIRYTADGLYPSDIIVVAHGDHMYVLSGMYTDPQTPLKIDFQQLVTSIEFIPTPSQAQGEFQGKLDIHAVCKDALAYMTFENGEAADAFVQACIEGKHPEVIEEFKKRIGVEDDRAI